MVEAERCLGQMSMSDGVGGTTYSQSDSVGRGVAPPRVIRVTEVKWFKKAAPVVPEGARAAVLASANGVLSVKFFDY